MFTPRKPKVVTSKPRMDHQAAARPRLAVMVVVDQFREPYLERYGDLFTGGFRRLLDQGRLYTRATHDHAVAERPILGDGIELAHVFGGMAGPLCGSWPPRMAAIWRRVSSSLEASTASLPLSSARTHAPLGGNRGTPAAGCCSWSRWRSR